MLRRPGVSRTAGRSAPAEPPQATCSSLHSRATGDELPPAEELGPPDDIPACMPPIIVPQTDGGMVRLGLPPRDGILPLSCADLVGSQLCSVIALRLMCGPRAGAEGLSEEAVFAQEIPAHYRDCLQWPSRQHRGGLRVPRSVEIRWRPRPAAVRQADSRPQPMVWLAITDVEAGTLQRLSGCAADGLPLGADLLLFWVPMGRR